jgi:adenylate cyclase
MPHGYIANHSGLSGARCLGDIGYQPDVDGVLRRLPARTRYLDQDYLDLASALLLCANPAMRLAHGDSLGMWRIPYSHEQSAYTVISAIDILRETVPANLIQGRYVLVGSSALRTGRPGQYATGTCQCRRDGACSQPNWAVGLG